MSETEPVEEEKPKKKEEPVKAPKNGPKARARMVFDVDVEKRTIKLSNRKCARCGAIMGHHKAPVERWTCGSCSYTDYAKQ